MSIEIINKEIKSPAIRTLVAEMWDTLTRIKNGEINHRQGQVENGAQRNLLAGLGLDWHFNKQEKTLPEIAKD